MRCLLFLGLLLSSKRIDMDKLETKTTAKVNRRLFNLSGTRNFCIFLQLGPWTMRREEMVRWRTHQMCTRENTKPVNQEVKKSNFWKTHYFMNKKYVFLYVCINSTIGINFLSFLYCGTHIVGWTFLLVMDSCSVTVFFCFFSIAMVSYSVRVHGQNY